MSSSPAVLKQQAAALELKKQPEKALALYQQLLAEHGGADDVDVALRNRVGDLHLRVGQVDEAIALFERSADEYALSGFLNNAIALCNKILRQRPGHVPTLRRLARFSAEKGMVVDAQRHYLSVAEALEKLGQHDDALKALSEFAELSPEDVHVRSVVVEQLLRAGRKPDALPHLTVLHRLHALGGRGDEADGVAQVAREIDESWVPESEQERAGKRGGKSLILIASDDDFGVLETSPMPDGNVARFAPVASVEGLELTSPPETAQSDRSAGGTLDGFEATSFDDSETHDGAGLEVLTDVDDVTADGAEGSGLADTLEFLTIESVPEGVGAVEGESGAGDALSLDFPFGFMQAETMKDASDVTEETIPSFGTMEALTEADRAEGPLTAFVPDDLLFDVESAPSGLEFQPMGEAASEPIPTSQFGSIFLDELLPPVEPEVVPARAAAVETPFRPKRPTPTYVNLAEILREDEPATARMTIGEPRQTGDHEADFQHILSEFRDGIERTIPFDDADSHFDLGIAFREMGLIDDAIAEFQIAARSRLKRVESIEALGGCFLDKDEPSVAVTLLKRALDEPAAVQGDDILRGVLYLLGRASEQIGARDEGLRYYQRVYAVDIRFRDVAARIQTLQQPA